MFFFPILSEISDIFYGVSQSKLKKPCNFWKILFDLVEHKNQLPRVKIKDFPALRIVKTLEYEQVASHICTVKLVIRV